MKVVGISGSPRKGKTTDFAVKKVLESVRQNYPEVETEYISLAGKKISGCISCEHCRSNFECLIKDDFTDIAEILKDKSIKAIVFGSPVYFGGMTSQLKALIDRTVMFRRNNFYFSGIIASAVAVGGSRNGGQEIVAQNIQSSMLIHDMTIISDGANTAHFGGIGWERVEGGVENDPHSLATFENLGRKIAQMIK